MAKTATRIHVRPLTPTIGAEVSGIALRDAPFDDGIMRQVQDTLAEHLVRFQKEWPPTEHPVIRTHPWTGRRALSVNANFTTRLCQLEPAESDTLLEFLLRHLQRPDFQVRFTWDEQSVALWDKRCTQHYAIPDYTGQRRVMNRVTVEGERPYFDPALGALT